MGSLARSGDRAGVSILRGGAVLLFTLVLAGCSGSAPTTPTGTSAATPEGTGTTGGDPLLALYQAAKAEGTFSLYGNADPPYVAELFAAFTAKYPGINPTSVQQSAGDTVQQVLTAIEAGQPSPADVMLTKFQNARPLFEKNELDTATDWASLGVPTDVVAAIAGGVEEVINPFGLAYNTDLVKPEDLPTTWDALVDQKWKDKIAICSTALPFDILSASWGTDKTVDYVKRLRDTTNARVIDGCYTPEILAVNAGEVAITPAPSAAVQQFKTEGAPIAWVPLDPIPVDRTTLYVLAKSGHINAARLFVAWQATGEARMIAAKYLRSNVLPSDVPTSISLVFPKTAADYDVVANTTGQVKEFLAGLVTPSP